MGDKFKETIPIDVGVTVPLPPDILILNAADGLDLRIVSIVATSDVEVAKYLNDIDPEIGDPD